MKKYIWTIIALLLITAVPQVFAQTVLQKPVAVVNLTNAEMITASQLDQKVREYKTAQTQAGGDASSITDEGILKIMINDILVLQGAKRDGISLSQKDLDTLVLRQKESVAAQLGAASIDDEQFAKILNDNYGFTIDEYREKIYQNYIVDTYVRSAKGDMLSSVAQPTEKQVQDYYKKNAANFINPEYVEISHLFLSVDDKSDSEVRSLAERLRRNIRYGVKSFESLVAEYSDDTASKTKAGRIGWLAIDDAERKKILGADFFETAFDLDDGEISQVVRSPAGYHILKVLIHRDPRLLKLDDTVTPGNSMTVREYISQSMFQASQSNAYNAAISSLIADLRDEADIEILLDKE
jgi:parvulin-like peptidyl-prolyl isomerase